MPALNSQCVAPDSRQDLVRAERFGVRAMIGGREPHVSLVEALLTQSVPVMKVRVD